MKKTDIQIIHTSWHTHQNELGEIRRKVFIEEQHVPEDLEWDEYDESCHHILAIDTNNQPVATGRIKLNGHIGRMAVLTEWRNQGIGTAILDELLAYAVKQNIGEVFLHAQVSAIPFYSKQGFKICSDEFIDAGIPHRTMKKLLVAP